MSVFSTLPKCVALALFVLPSLTPAALAQSRGGGGGSGPGEAAALDNCGPGAITCYATQDANCRSSGGFIRLRMTSADAVTLECTSDRNDLNRVFAQERAQTTTCTSGHLCIRHGTRTGDATNIYRQMVGAMNSCLQSQGYLEVHAILSDGPNTSTLYAGCVRRA